MTTIQTEELPVEVKVKKKSRTKPTLHHWADAISKLIGVTSEELLNNPHKFQFEFRGETIRTINDMKKVTFVSVRVLEPYYLQTLRLLLKGENPLEQLEEQVNYLEKSLTYNGVKYSYVYQLCAINGLIGYNKYIKQYLAESKSPEEFHSKLDWLIKFGIINH